MSGVADGAARFAPTWRARRVDAADGVAGARLPEPFVCATCGSPEVRCVGSGSHGTVAGGETWYDVACAGCGTITEYAHAWG